MARRIIPAILIIVIVVLACVAYIAFVHGDIGEFGTDYWFETKADGTEVLVTADGWTFDLNVRQEYTLEGIILGTKYYYKHDSPYSPINTFSPIDIFVGVDEVANNVEKYDYEITQWEDRELWYYLYTDNTSDFEYFRSHTGNNHLIPHNNYAFSKILELETGDRFKLTGHIVEPYGTRGDMWYSWPSDNQIGNYACEVILVNTIVVLDIPG